VAEILGVSFAMRTAANNRTAPELQDPPSASILGDPVPRRQRHARRPEVCLAVRASLIKKSQRTQRPALDYEQWELSQQTQRSRIGCPTRDREKSTAKGIFIKSPVAGRTEALTPLAKDSELGMLSKPRLARS